MTLLFGFPVRLDTDAPVGEIVIHPSTFEHMQTNAKDIVQTPIEPGENIVK